jgi:putative Mg2+ transporter-C (MgtC) family protein
MCPRRAERGDGGIVVPGPTVADLSEIEIIGRLLLAAALGAAIGAEREADGKDAGLRTHMILAIGAAVFGLVSVGAWDSFITGDRTNVQVDVTRVASYVAAGIGFIGGGAILKHAGGIRGLTTAASLWIAASVGLAAGVGLWAAALTATVITLLSLLALKPLGGLVKRAAARRDGQMTVVLSAGAPASAVLAELESAGVSPVQVSVGHGERDMVEVVAVYGEGDADALTSLAARMHAIDGVSEVHLGRA